MNTNPTMQDQLLEALADSLARRLWRGVVLPGIGLQLTLFVAFSFSLGLTSLWADDDQPPVVVASLPAEGQPPAPSTDKPAVSEEATPVKATQPQVVENAVVEKIAIEQPPVEAIPPADTKADVAKADVAKAEVANADVANAEVTNVDQIEQLGAKSPAPDAVRELSVEPVLEKRPMLPADRPAWVGAPNDTSQRVHRLYVASFTADTREDVEADEMLDDPLVAAVQRYLDETLFPGQGAMDLPITPEFVRSNLLDNSTSYVAAMTTQSGTEYQKWVVLQVTPEQREYFAGQLREHKQRQRMAVLGVGLAGILGLTGLANLAFNRRRRRYPDAVTPITMAIMPGSAPVHGQAIQRDDALRPGNGNPVQYVAAAAPVAMQAPRKKRSFVRKALILMFAAGLVMAFVFPAVVKVRTGPHRTEATRIEVDGRIWEIKTTQPLFENELSDHN